MQSVPGQTFRLKLTQRYLQQGFPGRITHLSMLNRNGHRIPALLVNAEFP
jgi:hypothetical protein